MANAAWTSVPFHEAIDNIDVRAPILKSYYLDLEPVARARAFTIAGTTQVDALSRAQESILNATKKGLSFKEWQAGIIKDGTFRSVGFGRVGNANWHSQLVFRQTQASAYAVGNWDKYQQNKGEFPVIQYSAVLDGRTRPHHAALDGFIAPVDSALWSTIFPPNGFNCRCTTISLTDSQMKRRGLKSQRKLPEDGFPDKDFDTNVGADYFAGQAKVVSDRRPQTLRILPSGQPNPTARFLDNPVAPALFSNKLTKAAIVEAMPEVMTSKIEKPAVLHKALVGKIVKPELRKMPMVIDTVRNADEVYYMAFQPGVNEKSTQIFDIVRYVRHYKGQKFYVDVSGGFVIAWGKYDARLQAISRKGFRIFLDERGVTE